VKSGEQAVAEENDEIQEGEIESMQSILNELEFKLVDNPEDMI
jgi:hypothetical protein